MTKDISPQEARLDKISAVVFFVLAIVALFVLFIFGIGLWNRQSRVLYQGPSPRPYPPTMPIQTQEPATPVIQNN